MKRNRAKGSALITVIIVMAVLMILGTVILQVSLFQVKQASYEDKRLQAQYLARAGAEASLSVWKNAPNGMKPVGESNTYFLNSDNQFSAGTEAKMPLPADKLGKFDVTITHTAPDTIIKSVGTVDNVSQIVTVSIKEITTTIPAPPIDWLDGADLGWYDYNSGQIIPGVHTPVEANKKVKLDAKKDKGLKLPNKNSDAVTYEADCIVSFSPVQVIHNSIKIITKVVSFNDTVDFKQNKGDLTLYVRDAGVDRTGLPPIHYPGTAIDVNEHVGVVYFQSKGYYFTNGVILKNDDDIAAKLIPIPEEDPNYINPYIGIPTQEIKSYTILWS